jgi:selenide,water dikinase
MASAAVRLTQLSPGAGCACKLPPAELARLTAPLAGLGHPNLLVGPDASDDAAVWIQQPDRALVLTADFLTPVVDEARTWGRIAAVNAASDVYAMGGRPLLALNLVAWNAEELGFPLLAEVMAGASEAAAEGGWVVAGGHSISDPHPTFGQAVVGEVHPDRVLTNRGLRSGDVLVLSKALGVGVITTAIKADLASAEVVEGAVASMLRLNREASEVALDLGASAATDVTGFGLLGHLRRLVEGSGVGAVIEADRVPLLPGALALAEDGIFPGGSRRNLEWVEALTDVEEVAEPMVALLSDAQTSGGLLMALPAGTAGAAVDRLCASGHAAAVVGRAVPGPARIRVVA